MNATVGDIAGNAERIRAGLDAAREAGAELVLFAELALTGYPPEDLLLREHFLADARAALARAGGRHARRGRDRRLSGARRRTRLQRRGRARRRRRPGDLPQGPPAQLRSIRRAALLPARELGRDDRAGWAAGWVDRLRGPLAARPAGFAGGRRRRAPDRQHLRLPLPRRQGRSNGSACSAGAPAKTAFRSPSAGWSAARTSCCSTATRSSSTTPARRSPARRNSRRICLLCDLDLDAAGPRPAGHRPIPRRRHKRHSAPLRRASRPVPRSRGSTLPPRAWPSRSRPKRPRSTRR